MIGTRTAYLDTDVRFEILRGNTRVAARRRGIDDVVATTWISASELALGAAESRAPEKNLTVVTELLATRPVIGPDLSAALGRGEIAADPGRTRGGAADAALLIVATILAGGASLVTGNQRPPARTTALGVEDRVRG